MMISVEPKSRRDLRALAYSIREILGLQNSLYFPIVELLDIFEETLPGFTYSIVEDNELPHNKHAVTNINTGEIQIKQSVYDGARQGNGRDRMTIAHEFAHFITLCFIGYKLYRSFDESPPPTFENPEWQAKCLAGELLIPHHLVQGLTVEDVVRKCGVSERAARYQLGVN